VTESLYLNFVISIRPELIKGGIKNLPPAIVGSRPEAVSAAFVAEADRERRPRRVGRGYLPPEV
jgi:hypothetical protein